MSAVITMGMRVRVVVAMRVIWLPATVSWTVQYGPSVEQFADFRVRSNASLSTTILAGLGFRIGVLNEYNNRPQPGVEKHDMLITTALTYSIGL